MIDADEMECQTMNCIFGKYEKEDNFYEKTYKDKHNAELKAISTTKQNSRKEQTNESIINSKGSFMDK